VWTFCHPKTFCRKNICRFSLNSSSKTSQQRLHLRWTFNERRWPPLWDPTWIDVFFLHGKSMVNPTKSQVWVYDGIGYNWTISVLSYPPKDGQLVNGKVSFFIGGFNTHYSRISGSPNSDVGVHSFSETFLWIATCSLKCHWLWAKLHRFKKLSNHLNCVGQITFFIGQIAFVCW
jgi:hypothetical protein